MSDSDDSDRLVIDDGEEEIQRDNNRQKRKASVRENQEEENKRNNQGSAKLDWEDYLLERARILGEHAIEARIWVTRDESLTSGNPSASTHGN